MEKLISLLDVVLQTKVFSVEPRVVRSAKVLRQRFSRNWDILWSKIEIPFRSKWKLGCSWNRGLSFVFLEVIINNPTHYFFLLSIHGHRNTNFATTKKDIRQIVPEWLWRWIPASRDLHDFTRVLFLIVTFGNSLVILVRYTVSWIWTNGWTNDDEDDDEEEEKNTWINEVKNVCVKLEMLFALCNGNLYETFSHFVQPDKSHISVALNAIYRYANCTNHTCLKWHTNVSDTEHY